jgi:tetratricopeptide (TPR) repeat protein
MATKHSEVRASMGALAGMMCLQSGDTDDFAEARKWLELAWSTGREPNSEPVARKYMNFGVEMTVTVAAGVQTQAGLTREAIALALVEIYQQAGELDLAIDLIDGEQINSIAAVSLAELCILKECFDEVIDMTDGITNEDDATALLCVFRGISLREKDMFVAAREAFKEALRIRSRNVEVRNRAWIERSACYLAEGKRGMARNDLERIMAVDSDYPGLIEALENLQGETPEESPEAD